MADEEHSEHEKHEHSARHEHAEHAGHASGSGGSSMHWWIIGVVAVTLVLSVISMVYSVQTYRLVASGAVAPAGAAAGTGGTAAAAAPKGDWSFEKTDPAVGPADAKVTVTEFADFQCPYCGIAFGKSLGGSQYDALRGSASKMITEYAAPGKIRFVYHTMAFLGQESIDAANAAFCARSIGGDTAYFKMHDELFTEQGQENSGVFTKDNLKKYAAKIGLGTQAMNDCIDKGTFLTQVSTSNSQANGVGVTGTPSFAVNHQSTQPDYASLKSAVDALLA